jgi:hypothetical protein
MVDHAKNLEFEKAAQVRDQLHVLKQQAFGAPGADNVVSMLQPGSEPDAAAAEGRAAMVVPVLFRHRARPAGYDKNRDFAKLIWQTASPRWNFDDATFDRSAASASTIPITSPSRSTTTAGGSAWRPGETSYDDLEQRWPRPGHRRADHHDGRRRQRRAPPRPGQPMPRSSRAKYSRTDHESSLRRHRPQPAAGGAAAPSPDGAVIDGREPPPACSTPSRARWCWWATPTVAW